MKSIAALLAFLALAAVASGQRAYRGVEGEIVGYDIPSGGKPFTRWCQPTSGWRGKTGFAAFEAYCDQLKGCVAVVAPKEPDGCAYFKTKGTKDVIKLGGGKWVTRTSQEGPQPSCAKFAALGEPCTSDPWSNAPVCCGGNGNPCVKGVCTNGRFPSSGR